MKTYTEAEVETLIDKNVRAMIRIISNKISYMRDETFKILDENYPGFVDKTIASSENNNDKILSCEQKDSLLIYLLCLTDALEYVNALKVGDNVLPVYKIESEW